MSGIGRTGKFLACQHYQERPHIICLSKGISSGYAPLGAMLVEEDVYQVLKQSKSHSFVHGHTFGGHPASVAVGIEVMNILEEENLIEHVAKMEEYWLPKLKKLRDKYPIVGDVRGKGLLMGIEFVRDNTRSMEPFDPALNFRSTIQKHCLKQGLYVYPGGYSVSGKKGDHILIAPPYIVTEKDLDRITEILDQTIGRSQKFFGPSKDKNI
jgi:adenosylmethionine-8-amino-7-oxononanoate aminotransferase